METKNFNYQNELLDFCKWLIEINKTLGSINFERAKLSRFLNVSKLTEMWWSNFYLYKKNIHYNK